MPWHDDSPNPWSPWRSLHSAGTIAHPDAPAGGSGPGYSVQPGVTTDYAHSWSVPDPHSPEGLHVTSSEAAAGHVIFEYERSVTGVRAAKNWDRLRAYAVGVLGPQSFGLGVCYGIVKNPAASIGQLFQLQKIFIEADIYERLTQPMPGWKRYLMSTLMIVGSNPITSEILFYLVKKGKITPADLKRSYDVRQALIEEVQRMFAHPVDFFENVKEEVKNSYLEKWARFKTLEHQNSLKSQFEAGEIFGDVLMDVVMLILTAISVGGAAAKLAAKVPQLVRVAEYVRGLRAAEAGGAAEETEEAVKATTVHSAKPLPPAIAEVATLSTDVSSNAKLVAAPGKTTTIIGVYEPDMKAVISDLNLGKNVDFGPKPGGFNVLDVPNGLAKKETFWQDYNQPWLQKAIDRGDEFILASDPAVKSNITRVNKLTQVVEPSGFGREVDYLKRSGYVYDSASKRMIKP